MDDAFAEITKMVLGEGANELIHKRAETPEEKKKRKQALVALGGNVLGLGAGVAALGAASKNPALKLKTAHVEHAGPITRKLVENAHNIRPHAVRRWVQTPRGKAKLIQAGAAGATGLQAANLGGDIVGNMVLRREAKKKGQPPPQSPRIAAVKEVKAQTKNAGIKTKEYGKKTKDYITKAEPTQSDLHLMGASGSGKLRTLPTKRRNTPMIHKNITWEGEISKVDEDKQQVFGWASITEIDGKPVVDLQGDYIDIEEIEKSAYDYVIKSRHAGNMHARDGESPKVVGTMIESFIVTPEKKEKLGLPDSMPTGWWVGYQVEDPDVWAMVKDGSRTGFSIHGRGVRTPMEI